MCALQALDKGTLSGIPFAKVLYATGATIPWVPLWFLPHLFLASAFATVAVTALKRHRPLLGLLAFGLLGLGAQVLIGLPLLITALPFPIPLTTGLPWSIDLLPLTAGYVLVGYWMRDYLPRLTTSRVAIACSALTFLALHVGYNEAMDLNRRAYGDLFISTVQALAGIHLTCSVASLLTNGRLPGRILAYIGSNSLAILIFHVVIQDATFNALAPLISSPTSRGLLSFLVASAAPPAYPGARPAGWPPQRTPVLDLPPGCGEA